MTQSAPEIKETLGAIGNLVHFEAQEAALRRAREREPVVQQFRASLADEYGFRQHPELLGAHADTFELLFLANVPPDHWEQMRGQVRKLVSENLRDDACQVLAKDVYLRELEIACLEQISSDWPKEILSAEWIGLIAGRKAELMGLLDRTGC